MDAQKIKHDFPVLSREVNGQPLVYLDSAATSQKPQVVIDAIVDYYTNHNANVHRGIHTLGDESTRLYTEARETVARFIGAKDPYELVFVRNTTEAINLVAFSWGLKHLKAGDEVLLTELEHHSNVVTWQRVCDMTGARLQYVPVSSGGDLDSTLLESLVTEKTKLIAMTQVSNVTGTVVDVRDFVERVRKLGLQPKVLVDAAQSVPHMPVHVHDLEVDFLVFSGHKMCGPMGIGGLWVRREVLETMDPFLVGGGMIDRVEAETATWAELPDRFDAGTPNVAGAVGLAAACAYLDSIGMDQIHEHEKSLVAYGLNRLGELGQRGWVEVYGPRDPVKRGGVLTFNVTGVHAHDVAQILDREVGVAVRSGHHCNQLILEKLHVPATVRASVYLYNTTEDIDTLIEGIGRVREVFGLH